MSQGDPDDPENDSYEAEPDTNETEIEAELGALAVSVSNHDPSIAEEQFKEIWEYVTADAGDWSDAMRARLTNYQ